MALIELYKTPLTYEKAGHDEWDEVYEGHLYLYDDSKNQFLQKKIYGRDNARNPIESYYKEDSEKIIEKNDLPDEALKIFYQLEKRT